MSMQVSTIRCQTCGYTGHVLVAHHGYKWWMLLLGFLLACTGIGLVPLAIILIWLGNRTYHCCPSCRGQQHAQWSGKPSAENQAIWAGAKADDHKAFKRNKWILFAVVMTMLAASLVFMFVMLQNP